MLSMKLTCGKNWKNKNLILINYYYDGLYKSS